ncbi:response regulator transcription factor [Paenibacillus camelliae]|uniref:response regulator transcription factor n=1 Tax=Paenibacillus camelliae TaxID=512410 RepID=UPI0020404E23|nr:response regulator [Paenibacillus camelliae]MCM3633931.1 response regulator [Paenibacillus camelliae]
MINVIIIDDEEPLREAIKILGQWEELGVSHIYEANNGKAALELLAQHSIDIALIDMKMPEMNGKQLLQELERKYPRLLTIVISGYDDFEYTKQAIRSRVVDYLLKPINRQELNQSLRKAVDLMEARRKEEEESIHQNITLNMSLPKLKEKLYLSLIDRSYTRYYNEDLVKLIGADQPNQLLAAVSIYMLNMKQLAKRRFKEDIDLLHFAVTNIVHDITSSYFQSFSFANPKRERDIITILTFEGSYREDMLYKLYHQMNKLSTTLRELFQLEVVIGIGSPVHNIQELTVSFDQAKRAVMKYDLKREYNSGAVMKSDDALEGNTSDYQSVLTRLNQLKQASEAGRAMQSFYQYLAGQLEKAEQFTLGQSEKLLEEMIIMFNDVAMEFGVASSKLPIGADEPLRVLGIDGDYSNTEQLGSILQQLVQGYKEMIDQEQQQDTSFKIQDIKKYIDQYYYEDIKVTMFAEKYYLSREYLMKLFKQQYGRGIHEYVQHVRMEKAKELLADEQLKVQEISDMLGYKDNNYFSKAFRNRFNMTPSEYRQSLEPKL